MLTGDGGAPDAPACASGQAPRYLSYNDIEGNNGFTFGAVTGTTNAWLYDNGYAGGGVRMLYGNDLDATSDSAATETTNIPIPAGASLRFRHAYSFEAAEDFGEFYDGGVIEFSENGGSTWAALAADYDGPLFEGFGNPLAGRDAFSGVSAGYAFESVSLGALAGKTVKFRFRIATDEGFGDIGWVIDDIGVHTCAADTTAPETTLTGGPIQNSYSKLRTATFTFASNELGSKFECKLDSGMFTPCRSPEPLAGLADGAHTFQVRAIDPAGLRDPSTAIRNWTVDTTKPVTAITVPSTNGAVVADTTPSFTFAAPGEPTAVYNCSIDGVLKKTGCVSPWTSDTLTPGNHTFSVTGKDKAGNVQSPASVRTFTVTARYSISTTSAADEGTGTDRLVITREGGSGSGSVKVISTAAGTARSPGDFTALPLTTVSFTGTETTKTVPLTIANDTVSEGTETIGFTLSSPVNGVASPTTGLVNLVDNDPPVAGQFSFQTPAAVSEAAGGATITIRRAGGNGTASVLFSTGPAGTATSGVDFTAVTQRVTFTGVETSKTVRVPIINDTRDEPTETIALRMSSPVNGTVSTPTASQPITDND